MLRENAAWPGAIRILLGMVGVGYIAWLLAQGAGIDQLLRYSERPGRIGGALGLLIASTALTSVAWGVWVGSRQAMGDSVVAYLRVLPGKYIPGGIWQGLGQANELVAAGSNLRNSVGATASFALLMLPANAAVALLSIGAGGVRRLVAIFAIAVISGFGVLASSTVRGRLARLMRLKDGEWLVGVSTGRVLSALLLAVCGALSAAGAFALLTDAAAPQAISAFAAAWTIGYLAIPVPAGIGIREAALLALMPASLPEELAAASVAHRAVAALADGLLFGAGVMLAAYLRRSGNKVPNTRSPGS